ncbi:MAG: FeoB-associated Cys-rich membrane protein [Clostridia bacterium]|nr:FeoB-associated Cys-rich membrane protein [Clostridia bacterium]
MLHWLWNNISTLFVVLLLIIIVAIIIIRAIKGKKSGNFGCCNCGSCPMSGNCNKK